MKELYQYIYEDSPQNALKILNEIITATEKVIDNPECYNIDKFKTNNDGSYRAFEKNKYRIAYRFKKNIVRVLRIRHTKREPKNY